MMRQHTRSTLNEVQLDETADTQRLKDIAPNFVVSDTSNFINFACLSLSKHTNQASTTKVCVI